MAQVPKQHCVDTNAPVEFICHEVPQIWEELEPNKEKMIQNRKSNFVNK